MATIIQEMQKIQTARKEAKNLSLDDARAKFSSNELYDSSTVLDIAGGITGYDKANVPSHERLIALQLLADLCQYMAARSSGQKTSDITNAIVRNSLALNVESELQNRT